MKINKMKIIIAITFLYGQQFLSVPSNDALAELVSVLNNLESRLILQETPQWPIAPEKSKDGIVYIPTNKYFDELVNSILPKVYNDIFFVVAKFEHVHYQPEEEREALETNEARELTHVFYFTVKYMASRIQELNEEIIKTYQAFKDSSEGDKISMKGNLTVVKLYLNERLNGFSNFYKFLQDIEKYALYLIKTKFTKIVLFTKSKKPENIGKYDAFMQSLSTMIKNFKAFMDLVSE